MSTETGEKYELLKGKHSVDNYPYGRLQCVMTFEVEYNKGKGYRAVRQSTNPKTGRLNAPKKGTYNHFMYMVKNNENGHIEFKSFDFYGYDSILKVQSLLRSQNFRFTPTESQDLWALAFNCIRGNARWTTLKEGVTMEQFLDATNVREMIIKFKEDADFNDMVNIEYNLDEIKSLQA